MTEELLFLISDSQVTLLKIVSFTLGYLTIRLGYNLITSGTKGEFKFSAEWEGAKAVLASFSPGLLFVLLGIILIGFTMKIDKETEFITGYNETTKEKPKQTKITIIIHNIPTYESLLKYLREINHESVTPNKIKGFENNYKKGQEYFAKGVEEFKKGEWLSAIIAFELCNDHIDNYITSYNLACAYWNAGNIKQASANAGDALDKLDEPYRSEAKKMCILAKMQEYEPSYSGKRVKVKKAPQ
jgi:tetratricopeptide (TPR) repeat protein